MQMRRASSRISKLLAAALAIAAFASPVAANAVASFSSWSQVASAAAWKGIACSTNCETSYAPVSGGSIWKSNDGGATWTELTSSGSRSWSAVATSGDATVVYATVSNGGVYKSSDSGASWNLLSGASTRDWRSIATNLSGSVVAAGAASGSIWSSIDGGSNWVQQSSAGTTLTWTSIDLTDDGATIVASAGTSGLWRGTGTAGSWTWSSVTLGKTSQDSYQMNSQNWYSVITDSTGTKIAATAGDLYFSNDSGATWKHVTSGNYYWISLSGSSDLKRMIMVSGDGANSTCVPHQITTSDYVSFTESTIGTVWVPYRGVAVAKDNSRAIAVTASSYIYRTGDSHTPAIQTTTTLTIAGDARVLTKRSNINLTAAVSAPGKVTFYANGKRVANCIALLSSTSAICAFRPASTGSIRLRAELKPTSSTNLPSNSVEIQASVVNRKNTR